MGKDWIKPTNFGVKLREVREAINISQKTLAERVGCSFSVIQKLEQGIQEPTWPTLLAIARVLGVPASVFEEAADNELVTENRSPGRPKRSPLETGQVAVIPVLGCLAAGPGSMEEVQGEALQVNPRYVSCVAYRVRGHSMEDDLIEDGDIVIVRPQDSADVGDTVAVWIHGLGGVVKKLGKVGRLESRGRGRWFHTITSEDTLYGIVVALQRDYLTC